jgi:hypothetical protein
MWDYVALVACFIGLALAGIFAIEFHRRTHGGWRDNPFGRFLFTRKLLLCALFGHAILARLWGWYAEVAADPLGALLLCTFALHTILPYRFLLQAQQERADIEEDKRR